MIRKLLSILFWMTLYTSGIVWAVSIYYGYKMPCERLKFAIECNKNE